MANHDEYGKRVLAAATERHCKLYGPELETYHGVGGCCRIDGVVKDIAVEIEARTGKQIRGALMDLVCHALQKKLLVLLPTPNMNAAIENIRCANILARFCDPEHFRVVVLTGHGDAPRLEEDAGLLKAAFRELGFGQLNDAAA